MPTSRSFPSGHSAAAFAFATGVGHVSPAAAIPLRALAALVAYSRVHTGVHYPGDVLAGALIGITVGAAHQSGHSANLGIATHLRPASGRTQTVAGTNGARAPRRRRPGGAAR